MNKKYMSIFILTIMIFSPILVLLSPQPVKADNMYSNAFVVSGGTENLTDQWVFINIAVSSEINGSGNTLNITGLGTADFSDIRFTDSVGNNLNYVKLYEIDNTIARFAVELNYVAANVSNSFMVRWGDPSLTDQSNLSAPTFVDLFSTAPINTTLWTESPGTYDGIVDGVLEVYSYGGESQVIGNINITDEGYTMDTRIMTGHSSGYGAGILEEVAMINPDIEISEGYTYNSNPGEHALWAQDYNLGGMAWELARSWAQFDDNDGPWYWTSVIRSSWTVGTFYTITLKSQVDQNPQWYMNDELDGTGYNGYYCNNLHPEFAATGETYWIAADYIIIVPYNDLSIEGWAAPPTYSTPSVTTTVAGASCQVSIPLGDAVSLYNVTFSTNNTGVWVNATTDSITGTSYLYNQTFTLNSTVGTDVAMKWYIYNTGGIETTTITYYIVTQAPSTPTYLPSVVNIGYAYYNQVSWLNCTLDMLGGIGTTGNISNIIITLSNGVVIGANPEFNSTGKSSDPNSYMTVEGWPTSYLSINNSTELTAHINTIFADSQPQQAIYITSVEVTDSWQDITMPTALYWCTVAISQSYVYYNSTADNITMIDMNLPPYTNATVYVNYSSSMNLGWLGIALVHAFSWQGTSSGSDWSQWGVYIVLGIAELFMLMAGAHYVAIMGCASAMFLGAVNMAVGIPVFSWGVIGTIAFIVIIELLTKRQGLQESDG
jgi:hypothetical protein